MALSGESRDLGDRLAIGSTRIVCAAQALHPADAVLKGRRVPQAGGSDRLFHNSMAQTWLQLNQEGTTVKVRSHGPMLFTEGLQPCIETGGSAAPLLL